MIHTTRLIDTFLFSESFETEVLLAKLHVESEIVDHWVAVENSFTTKGAPKEVVLRHLLDSDERFRPFRDRLAVVTLARPYAQEFRLTLRQRLARAGHRVLHSGAIRHYLELPFFFAERAQRDAATELVLAQAGPGARVIVSDVDEMVDGSTPLRREIIRRAGSCGAALVKLPRRRFVFDFDNLSMGRFMHVPMVAASSVASGAVTLGAARMCKSGVPASAEPVVFEYSYCYSPAEIARKLSTFAHLDPGSRVLERALRCNHALTDLRPGDFKSEWWFEKIGLDEARHPRYVEENLSALATGSVNPLYREARRTEYPSLFGTA